MAIPIPPAKKPIQLYLWSKCGFCTKQKAVFDAMKPEMRNWIIKNVDFVTVENPSMFPSVKGYPYWMVYGKPNPGFKNLSEIMNIRKTVDNYYG